MASPNMNAIARAAGVGKATVSLALRNDPRLRPETRERIQKVAQEMGYHQNAVVSHLMAQLRASRDPKFQATIALINASNERDSLVSNPTFRSWAEGCQRRCVELGYGMDEFWLHEPGISPARLRQILQSRNIHGAIVAAVLTHRALPAAFTPLWSELACVVAGIRPADPPLHFACNDQFSTAMQTAEELRRRGYTRPGLVIDRIIEENIDFRFSAGFYAGQGVSEIKRRIPTHDFDPKGEKAFKAWFKKHKPDVIICAHKEVRAWLANLEVRVPKDIGLVHLDCTKELEGWSGMNQNNDLVGAAAVDLVVGELHRNEAGIPAFPKCVMIESQWVEGSTLKPRK